MNRFFGSSFDAQSRGKVNKDLSLGVEKPNVFCLNERAQSLWLLNASSDKKLKLDKRRQDKGSEEKTRKEELWRQYR